MECFSIKAVQSRINQLQPGDWFIVDIDDTLITPQAMMFRPTSPFCTFIDDIKKSASQDVEKIVSTWRLNRRTMLVEEEWPAILDDLKERGVIVIALTQMDSGTFGDISSMEKWRANELKGLGITFSPFSKNNVETLIEIDRLATLHQGILFTGSHSKADVLISFIKKYGIPPKILFFDDRLYQVEALEKCCEEMSIPFEGYHYLAAAQLPYDAKKDYGFLQKQKLLDACQWIEDSQIPEELKIKHG